jgi:iron complex transport system substrate-binding protein
MKALKVFSPLFLLFSFCSPLGGEIYLTEGSGEELVLAAPPTRLISLAPSLTKLIYLLGEEERLVGVTVYCDYPPAAKKKEKIGTVLHPNLEKIVKLRPDLVLATREGNRPQTIKKLKSLNIKVFVFKKRQSLAEINRDLLLMAKILEKEKEAEKIIQKVEAEISEIQRKMKKVALKRVFWQVGSTPLVTASEKTFAHQIISLAGGINIAAPLKPRYPRLSLEEVIIQNPEVIIIVEMGQQIKVEIKKWQKFNTLSAVKNKAIYSIPSYLVCSPDPVIFVQAVKEVARLIHPEQDF